MQRKTYHNVLKQEGLFKKGYSEKESLEMAVKIFDNMKSCKMECLPNGFIDKIIKKNIK